MSNESGVSKPDEIAKVINTLAWNLVLKNKPALQVTAVFDNTQVEFVFALKDPDKLNDLINTMTAKP